MNIYSGTSTDFIFFKELAESSPSGFHIYDPETGETLYVNEALASIVGGTKESIMNKNVNTLESWDNSALRSAANEAIEKSKEVHVTTLVPTTYGKHVWFKAVFRPFLIGEKVYMMLNVVDITEYKNAQQKLEDTKEKLESALFGGAIGWWIWHIDTDEVESSENLTDYYPEEFPKTLTELVKIIHPEDIPTMQQKMNDHLAGKTDFYRAEIRMRNKQGNYEWYEERSRIVLRDSYDKPLKVAGTIININAGKVAQLELENSEAKFKSIFLESPAGILLSDEEGKFIEINDAFERITTLKKEDLLGKYVWDLMQMVPEGVRMHGLDDAIKYILQTGDISKVKNPTEVKFTMNGRLINFSHTIFPIKFNNSFRIGVILEDITKRKEAETELQNKMDEMERMNKLMIGREVKMAELKQKLEGQDDTNNTQD